MELGGPVPPPAPPAAGPPPGSRPCGPAPGRFWAAAVHWSVEGGEEWRRALIGLYLSFLWESSFLFLVFSILFPLGRPPLSGVVGWSPGAFSNGPFAPGNGLSIKLNSVNLVRKFTSK